MSAAEAYLPTRDGDRKHGSIPGTMTPICPRAGTFGSRYLSLPKQIWNIFGRTDFDDCHM